VTEVPPEFSARIVAHNRSCWVAAALSLLGAWLGWMIFFALYTAGVLVFETVRTGNTDLFSPPRWYWPSGAIAVAVLVLWGAVDRWKRRFTLPPDRSIIGWHLFPEVLLLPPRMTFAIWDQIDARITLNRQEQAEAWELLQTIFAWKRAEATRLTLEFPDGRRLSKLLTALQFAGWIDLHRGEENWFYRVLSDRESLLKALTTADAEGE
jgi:hypothetical protein